MTSFLTTGGMRGHSEKMLAKFFPRTHNMGIKRSVFEEIGGFGSLRHGQDIEYSNRIRKSGFRIKFLLDAIVYHRRRTSIKQFFKQVYNWGVARVNLGIIDSDMLELIHFFPAITILLITFCFILFQESFIQLFIILFIPLGLLALYGSFKKKDIRVFFYLLLVVPSQVFGYGLGFIQAFVRRFILGQKELVGFKKNYYK